MTRARDEGIMFTVVQWDKVLMQFMVKIIPNWPSSGKRLLPHPTVASTERTMKEFGYLGFQQRVSHTTLGGDQENWLKV